MGKVINKYLTNPNSSLNIIPHTKNETIEAAHKDKL